MFRQYLMCLIDLLMNNKNGQNEWMDEYGMVESINVCLSFIAIALTLTKHLDVKQLFGGVNIFIFKQTFFLNTVVEPSILS